jgi:hypothetical protein
MQQQPQILNIPSSSATRRQTARESFAILAENWSVFAVDPNAVSVKDDITGNKIIFY